MQSLHPNSGSMRWPIFAGVMGLTVSLATLVSCNRHDEVPPTPEASMPTESAYSRAAQLEQQLKELGAQQTDRGLVIVLTDLSIAPGQAHLELGSNAQVDSVAGLLGERSELQVRVVGYTDSRGSMAVNQRLSLRRAQAIRDALTAPPFNIDAQRVSVDGKGEAEPIAGNDTAEGREKNRRVELFVTDSTGRFSPSSQSDAT